ncbi:MAG: CHC2 zinc finger domain-containing protein [Candidatus Rokuibacteriota bacterium]
MRAAQLDAGDLFRRHLDLRQLRGRSRGVTFCPFHAHHARMPSCSIDLDRGLFCCHACGEQGGVKRFRELVGEAGPPRDRRPAPGETDWEAAWRETVRPDYSRMGVPRPARPLTLTLSASGGEGIETAPLSLGEGEGRGPLEPIGDDAVHSSQ